MRNNDEYNLTIEKKMNHKIAHTRQALSNRALLHQFLKLGKFVWRDFLHSMIQRITGI